MKRRTLLASALVMGCFPHRIAAQGAPTVARIGWLTAQRAPSLAPYVDTLRYALAELGHEEGRNLVIEHRYGDDSIERVPELAMELVRLPVSLIVVQGAAVSVVQKLNLPVPIVYVTSGDPVTAGFADSLSRPRGNMTGMTFMSAEMNVKRLELLREIVPGLRRVAVVANPDHPGEHLERAYLQETGARLGLDLVYFSTRDQGQLAAAFGSIASEPSQAICVLADGFAVQNREQIVQFATSQRLPVISGWRVFAQSGAICTYGPRLSATYSRLASYIDRILKGAKPADLPIERPTTFELILNLRTSRALDIPIPPTLLARADEVLE
jgi:putative tryptophan/tyrosine transport system substrate-binding protein